MPYRTVTASVIILFFCSVLIWTFCYGPSVRKFAVPRQTSHTTPSAQGVVQLWATAGVHGRIAVIFARHLMPQYASSTFPEIDFLDQAMRQGVVRRTFYVVPDQAWPQVVTENMARQDLIVPLRVIDAGFTLYHIGGRINVIPLSKFVPEGNEPVLTVIDRQSWTPQELYSIESYFRAGLLTTDMCITVDKAS